ncbi:hypothetical protein Ancab_036658 [Ancistrocladus abbreviatus]
MEKRCGIDDNVSSSDCTSQKDDTKCSAILPMRGMAVNVGSCIRENCVEGTSLEGSCSNGLSPSTGDNRGITNGNPRDAEITANSSERYHPTYWTAVKNDVTAGSGLPQNKRRKEMDVGAEVCRADNIDGNFKFKADSSSSNSSHAILSDSSHNNSHQERLVEVKPCKSSMNGSTNKIISKVSEFREKTVDVGLKASLSSSMDNVSGETIRLSSIGSADPNKEEYLKETGEHVKPSSQQDPCENTYPSQSLCSKKTERYQESIPALVPQSKDDLPEQHCAQKSERFAATNRSLHLYEFDLNEDMRATEVACAPKLITESVSSYHKIHVSEPIAVVAKAGVPIGFPRPPLQFDGELGWRSSATTSAFRPVEIKIFHRNKGTDDDPCILNTGQPLSCRGIDLNIAIAGDNSGMESAHVLVPSALPTKKSSAGASSKQSERFILDLNHQSENDENNKFKSGIRGFDLNHKLSVDDSYNDVYQSGPDSQMSRSCGPVDTGACSRGTTRHPNYDSTRPAYWVDLSSIPGLAHAQAQPFLVAAPAVFTSTQQMQAVVPFQSKVTFTAQTPPGIYIGTSSSLPSAMGSPGIKPHLSGQTSASAVPQISGSVLAAYPGSLHILERVQRLNPNGYTNLGPSFFLSGGVTSLENANRGATMKEFFVPSRNTLVDERMKSVQQVVASPTSMKRQEPEGGWDACSLSLDGRSHGARII